MSALAAPPGRRRRQRPRTPTCAAPTRCSRSSPRPAQGPPAPGPRGTPPPGHHRRHRRPADRATGSPSPGPGSTLRRRGAPPGLRRRRLRADHDPRAGAAGDGPPQRTVTPTQWVALCARDVGACSPAAPARPISASPTTSCTGPTAARPTWTTWRCSAAGTTTPCTTALGHPTSARIDIPGSGPHPGSTRSAPKPGTPTGTPAGPGRRRQTLEGSRGTASRRSRASTCR